MGFWKQIAEYLYIKKRDPNEPPRNTYTRVMHGMNRISIIVFLIAVIIIIVKLVVLPMLRKH